MIIVVVDEARTYTFRNFVEDRAGARRDGFRILDPDLLLRGNWYAPGTYVLSLDDLVPAERALLDAMWSQLRQNGAAVRLLNHPRETMGRLALLRALHDAGRSRVQAVRATESVESLRYPVFVREEVGHTANLTPLLQSPDEVRRALRGLALRGFHRRELLVVEFCDTADARGVYRKYSAYIVGDRIIARALEFGERWMVKYDPLAYLPPRIAEEREFVESNPHEAQLREIFALAHVQYGRVDYALLDGAVQAWEINLVPTVGRHLPHGQESEHVRRLRKLRRATDDIFYTRFLAAWDAVDTQPAAPEPLAVHVDRRLWNAARAERAAARRRERYRRAWTWASNQRAFAAVWLYLKPVLARSRTLITRGGTPARS